MKKHMSLSSYLCTVGAALLSLALAKGYIAPFVPFPELLYSIMLLLGGILILCGILVFIIPAVSDPTNLILEKITYKRLASRYECVYGSEADLHQLHRLYTEKFGNEVPSLNLMRSWVRRYRKAFTMVYRIENDSIKRKKQILVGSFKVLLLTKEAVEGLEAGYLTGSTFKPDHLARRQKDAAAYYIGDVVATTRAAGGALIAFLGTACQQAIKKGLPIYARPLSDTGMRLMKKNGFVQVADNQSEPAIGKMCRVVLCGRSLPRVRLTEGRGEEAVLERIRVRPVKPRITGAVNKNYATA